MSITQQQIYAMLAKCIDSIAMGNNLSMMEIDRLGYADLISEIAKSKNSSISGTLNSPAAILEAAAELDIITNEAQKEFLKRHELFVYIDAALRSLAHTDPKTYKKIEELWLSKNFHEKEELMETIPGGVKLKGQLRKAREEYSELQRLASTEQNRKKKGELLAKANRVKAEMDAFHHKFVFIFRNHAVRDVKKFDIALAIRKLKTGHAGGRSGSVQRRYAEALARKSLEQLQPQKPNKVKV